MNYIFLLCMNAILCQYYTSVELSEDVLYYFNTSWRISKTRHTKYMKLCQQLNDCTVQKCKVCFVYNKYAGKIRR